MLLPLLFFVSRFLTRKRFLFSAQWQEGSALTDRTWWRKHILKNEDARLFWRLKKKKSAIFPFRQLGQATSRRRLGINRKPIIILFYIERHRRHYISPKDCREEIDVNDVFDRDWSRDRFHVWGLLLIIEASDFSSHLIASLTEIIEILKLF